MPEIEIRPAAPPDFPLLWEIDHAFSSNYVWQMERIVEEGQVTVRFREVRLPRAVRIEYPYSRDYMEREWGNHPTVLLAGMSGMPVGYVQLKEMVLPQTALVKDLAVRPEVRRKGVASGLILAVQDWAAQRGMRRVAIEIQSKNHAGIELAKKLGFEFTGYQDRFYPSQDIALFFSRFFR